MRGWRLLPLAALLFAAVFAPPMNLPRWMAPFGFDEFGRNQLTVFAIATGRSIAFGATVAALSLLASVALALVLVSRRSPVLRQALRALTRIVESVPLLLWVLAAFAAMNGASDAVPAVAFGLAVVPVATGILVGEFERLLSAGYVDVARLLGIGNWTLLRRHVIPNAAGILTPMFVQVLGLATAVRGAVGLLGFGRRSDYDLGIILLRGREQLVTNPSLLAGGVLTFLILYLYLDWLSKTLLPAPQGDTRGVDAF